MKKCGSAVLTKAEECDLYLQYDSEEFNSQFSFLKDHKGLRKGQYHLFLGTTGSGKSSLVRSIICELASWHKVAFLSTEENHNDFKWKLGKSDLEDYDKKNIEFFMEDDDYPDIDTYFTMLENFLVMIKAEVLVFDNFTTSWLSRQPTWIQEKAPSMMLRLARKLDIPLIVVAHTGKNNKASNGELLDADNVRGNQTLVNRAPYLYIMQNFKDDDGRWYPILRIRKARFHKQDVIYALSYDMIKECYIKDKEIPFDKVLEIYRKRARLTDDSNKKQYSKY